MLFDFEARLLSVQTVCMYVHLAVNFVYIEASCSTMEGHVNLEFSENIAISRVHVPSFWL